jgi:hypothetical protein
VYCFKQCNIFIPPVILMACLAGIKCTHTLSHALSLTHSWEWERELQLYLLHEACGGGGGWVMDWVSWLLKPRISGTFTFSFSTKILPLQSYKIRFTFKRHQQTPQWPSMQQKIWIFSFLELKMGLRFNRNKDVARFARYKKMLNGKRLFLVRIVFALNFILQLLYFEECTRSNSFLDNKQMCVYQISNFMMEFPAPSLPKKDR